MPPAEQLTLPLAAPPATGETVELRMRPGYDHGYFFIASFIEDHLRHHAAALKG